MEILLFPNKFFDIMEHYMFEIKKNFWGGFDLILWSGVHFNAGDEGRVDRI